MVEADGNLYREKVAFFFFFWARTWLFLLLIFFIFLYLTEKNLFALSLDDFFFSKANCLYFNYFFVYFLSFIIPVSCLVYFRDYDYAISRRSWFQSASKMEGWPIS